MTPKTTLCLTVLIVAMKSCSSFSPSVKYLPTRISQWKSGRRLPVIFASTADEVKSEQQNKDDDESENILKITPKSELVALCEQFNLSTKGTKENLLQRLRDFAKDQEEVERERLMKRKKLVEEGSGDDREKYEIVDDEIDDDEEDEVFFYYGSKTTTDNSTDKKNKKTEKKTEEIRRDSGYVTAPPPNAEIGENGEKVVTIYSTNERNDLTGIAAAQPGQSSFDPLTSSTSDPTDAPWDSNNPSKTESSSMEIDAAKDAVTELVRTLLAMTGLPVFINEQEDQEIQPARRSKFDAPAECIDFDPSMVPTELLTKTSKSLRTSRGKVLREVIREFELRAIGDDGTAVDNVQRGGGHYRQVTRVRSFLEGFRQAEVRRLSRETLTLLLDKLVGEGIEGLDITLASMTRSSDDTSDEGGELNDSLMEYLDDTIRQQEKKVEQIVDSTKKISEFERAMSQDPEDEIENLWKVEDEDGQRIETFDPNIPENQLALQEEYERAAEESIPAPILPSSAPEKLLLLLKIVRERLKIEATFSHDEKSRNLRVLAYCLQLKTNALRKEMIAKEFGASLDGLDSFQELVASSIEYGESTSHQLHPSKTGALNVPLLKTILKIIKETRKQNTYKASGL
ncbi:unnamed protein product [Cylindrotheca closterium]|uniref:SAP domain-containing protein n=1 Tax=Cylindrotheca closterium TaxID=2856 RepID=A0AAD2CFQ8_9STRA|nr:unnamed protein product [Cylindrotheca closterium]